ncbi:hypothetical protein ALP23_05341 [Pseudomonas syringae pv. apii]|uniref:Uncharacterized protein n=1 Tax=Pseudomonas syringae pv. apii TaxID=81036 RepID=A0A3M5WYI8_9PSED|nr:hypothetical protein ALP23_05341 [Pseudomonas syringae pv. apii]
MTGCEHGGYRCRHQPELQPGSGDAGDLAAGLIGVEYRQLDLEASALADVGDAELAAHLVDDAVTDGQAQPGADTYRFSGEKRLENALQQPRINASTVVLDRQADDIFIALGLDTDPWLEIPVLFPARQQGIPGVDHQVDQHLLKLIDMTTNPHRVDHPADPQLHALAFHAFSQHRDRAFDRLGRIEQLLFYFRAATEYPHMIDHPGGALHLGVDAIELFSEVFDVHITPTQTLEDVDHGHAHDVERLIDLVGQTGGHLAKRCHLRALIQLHARAAYIGVVTAHRLHFDQFAVFIEYPPVGPYPPGILASRQLDTDFFGTHRRFRSQLADTLDECLALLVRQPVSQVDPGQLLGCALHILGQRPVAETQHQVRRVAADHGRRILDQNAVTLLATPYMLGGQGGLGHIQPQTHRLHRHAEVVTQQSRLVQQPVVLAVPVAQPETAADESFAQQLAITLEPDVVVVGMDVPRQLPVDAIGQRPAQQRREAVTEKGGFQIAVIITLHVNHGGRTGNQIIQPGMGGGGLGFLILDIADVQHEAQYPLHLPPVQRLPLNTKPEGFLSGVVLCQTYTEQQRRALVAQLGEATGQLLSIGGMNQCQPVLTRQALDPVAQTQTASQLRCQQNLVTIRQQFPPPGAQKVLKHRQAFDMVTVMLLGHSKKHRPGQRRAQVEPLALAQVRRLLLRVIKTEHQPGLGNVIAAVGDEKTVSVAENTLQRSRIDTAAKPQLLRGIDVESIQRSAQPLPDLPQLGRRMSAVLTINTPADTANLRQHQRHTGNAPQLREFLQLLAHHGSQAVDIAPSHTLGHLPGKPQALLAAARGTGFLHQVADIQQLQEPALAMRLHPASGVQGMCIVALEVQVEHVPQPVTRHTFDNQCTVGQQQTHQSLGSRQWRSDVQTREQVRADTLYTAFVIQQQIKVRTDRTGLARYRQGLRHLRCFTTAQPTAQTILFKGQVADSLVQSGCWASAEPRQCLEESTRAVPEPVGSWGTGWSRSKCLRYRSRWYG